jgi:hypothetical protein
VTPCRRARARLQVHGGAGARRGNHRRRRSPHRHRAAHRQRSRVAPRRQAQHVTVDGRVEPRLHVVARAERHAPRRARRSCHLERGGVGGRAAPPAASTTMRGDHGRRMGPSGQLRLDQQVAGHLQVQRRAELGAVHREHAGLVGDEGDVHVLAGLQRGVEVVRVDGEAVRGVVRLLEVGQVDVDRVALLDADDVGREVAADGGHVDVDAVGLALDALLAAGHREGSTLAVEGSVPGGVHVDGLSLSALIICALCGSPSGSGMS